MRKMFIAATAVLLLAGCGTSGVHADPENKNPRAGAVIVLESSQTSFQIIKFCDNSTLVYSGRDSIAVVPNSPEC